MEKRGVPRADGGGDGHGQLTSGAGALGPLATGADVDDDTLNRITPLAYDHIRILNTLFASGVWYEMTLSEIKVYVAICGHWNWQRLEAYPSIKSITEETRLSRRGVIYAVEKLKERGLIRVGKRGRKTCRQTKARDHPSRRP